MEVLTTNTANPTSTGAAQPQGAAPGETQPFRTLPEDAIIIVPVRGFVLFPDVVMPLALSRAISVNAAQAAVRESLPIGVLTQRDAGVDAPVPADMHAMGTLANVLRYVTAPDDTHHLILQGETRFRIVEFLEGWPFMVARVEKLAEQEDKTPDVEARLIHVRKQALETVQLLPQAPQGLAEAIQNIASASTLADTVSAYLDVDTTQKQELLETVSLPARLDRVSRLLEQRLQVLRLSAEIGKDVQETLTSRQREAILREQMAAIQRQLGEDDGRAAEIAELTEKIEAAKMPEAVEKEARKELRRLERMPEAAAEHGIIRTYLDWLTELPWDIPEEQPIDIAKARETLDADHYGLDKIKRRIVEYLAVRKLAPGGKAPILCFAGPPGVGKTSLGQSIARAMGRPFERVSLGGVHDESEIRGHRRTYVGAMPGNIIQAIRKAGRRDCVIMLDEIDKMGRGVQGDPSAAMLEVLDPEQNGSFRDNYLGVPFDLSRVVFIATANMLETIPGPLRDRMEIITLSGYTEDEKLAIAQRYLVARQLAANGVTAEQVTVDDAVLSEIIRYYTREAGVRNLEREIGKTIRNAAVRIAEGSADKVSIGVDDLHEVLGDRIFENEVAQRTSVPGVATGMAWTPVGGDILFIEATKMSGSGRLILTGQLGDVMKESAQAALSLLKSRANSLGVSAELLEKSDIHVHVPAGATPKDGPSAGVAMFMALTSLLTGRTVRSDTSMTGEISLRGLVLPVGGIKEKVVAAASAGITRVMLPARNKRDYDDIPANAREKLEFIWLETVEDALAAGLDDPILLAKEPAEPTDA
ncbi:MULTISPECIES: endopeptidase La [unclassified Sphingobium]|uniref:endopeptidase La n=1 Tax=unclassified Sphingobium TaxID=2611147 RepID=UPI00222401B9|nr:MULTISPECIES: endopeptidase La [unclassified Sphingobium]MCW2411036.1 ATP-dependent Lon protease [Sphingobium sp. B8D3D]MCW2416672.1 ATP-dependent Lon protease [Sphingobium sp. B8D3A]